MEQAGVVRTDVVSAADMAERCKASSPAADVVIMSAAVADYRPVLAAGSKLKKTDAALDLRLEPTEDILAWLGAHNPASQLLVGFALETDNELEHAKGKLHRKNADLLVLNSLRDAGAGFGTDTNKVTLLTKDTDPQELPLMPKADVARAILDRLEELL